MKIGSKLLSLLQFVYQYIGKNITRKIIEGIIIIMWTGLLLSMYKTINYTHTRSPQTTTGDVINSTKKIVIAGYKEDYERMLNRNGFAQKPANITGENRVEAMHQMLTEYGHDNYHVRQTVARIHNIYPEVLICIAKADSTLGRFLKSAHNYGNVGNNDRGDTVAYGNSEQGINAIGRVLNNKYLGDKMTIGDLSARGNCKIDCDKFYATSTENWEINVLNCISQIRGKKVNHDFKFRF